MKDSIQSNSASSAEVGGVNDPAIREATILDTLGAIETQANKCADLARDYMAKPEQIREIAIMAAYLRCQLKINNWREGRELLAALSTAALKEPAGVGG